MIGLVGRFPVDAEESRHADDGLDQLAPLSFHGKSHMRPQASMRCSWIVPLTASLLAYTTPAWSAPSAPASPPSGPQPANTAKGAKAPHSLTEISGCLAQRSQQPMRKRELPNRKHGAILVEHALRHACCLKGKVETKVSGEAVEVMESLRGNPCRCMCSSTLRTRVPLPPGTYRLTVWLDNRGKRQRLTQPRREVQVSAERTARVVLGARQPKPTTEQVNAPAL
jgi:hypothetical protein